jgi:integrase
VAKRRGKGEGSITQLADGRWQARVDLGYINGKRVRKAYYGATRKEVQTKLNSALVDNDRGIPLPSEKLTVAQFLESWLQTKKPRLRPRTYLRHAQIVRDHISPEIGRILIAKLTPRDVQRLLNQKQETKLSDRSVAYVHAVLRHALAQAEKWGIVARNVARLVDAPKATKAEAHFFTIDQARELLKTVKDDRIEALYVLALSLGLRQGELLGLRWQDVDLDTGRIRLEVQIQRIGGKLVSSPLKTERSRRLLVLPEMTREALKNHRTTQLKERLKLGPAWEDHGLVFTTGLGRPIDARNLIRHYTRALKNAGIPYRNFHTLRHTAASLLLANGGDLFRVQQVLGHSQISLTADLYGHAMPALLEDVAARMDRALSG